MVSFGRTSAEMQTIACFCESRLPKCRRLGWLWLNVCRGCDRWELPAADDLTKYQKVSANSGRICIRLNVFLHIVCNLQAKREVRAADEIVILAVLSVFWQMIEFEKGERLHFGRRAWDRNKLSAGVEVRSGTRGWRLALWTVWWQTNMREKQIVCWGGGAERHKSVLDNGVRCILL